MNFQLFDDFLQIASKCHNFPEFAIECTLHGKSVLSEQKFFEDTIKPILNMSAETFDSHIDARKLNEFLYIDLVENVSFLDEYRKTMENTEN